MAGCTNILKGIKVIVLVLLFFLLQTYITEGIEITELKDDRQITKQGARHFCYLNNIKPSWRESWTRIQVQVWSSKDLKVTVVEDEEELEKLESFSFWTFVQYFIKEQTNETHVPINLFAPKTCFKVDPSDSKTSYTVKPSRKWDVFLFAVFLTGVVLFFFADILSKSQMFYYSGGISVGMIASLLILIYIMARFLPKKSPFYVLLAGGWSLSFYVIQLAFKNMKIILREHWHLAVGYTVLVGFVSFAVCYRHGPLVNQRSIDILSWSLQLIGLLLMYAGIQVQQVALAIMVAAFCAKYMDYPINLAIAVYNRRHAHKPWADKWPDRQADSQTDRQGLCDSWPNSSRGPVN
ncbi:nuclear envelope integral membrane protein 1 isoform X2 [Engraulis encrasicolus]|uniref:nuclear envelope integral membrane protein 1 isoform X2 n=1 Tax=Engraulis encrasicolus TaxID=184585 RepID=UPI002FD61E28